MKKIATLLSVLALSACGVYAGDHVLFPNQNSIFELWKTESIFYYEQPQDEEILTASKTITEEDISKGEVLITKVGKDMAFSKTYRTDFFDMEVLRVNKDATLSSSTSPYHIKKGAEYIGFGEVTIDGEKYMLIRQGKKETDILLVNGDGEVYNRIGRIVKGRLALLNYTFFIYPEDVRFVPVVSSRSERSDYLDGFELRYDGIKNNNMIFTYITLGEECYDEEFKFPLTDKTLTIKDLTVEVIDVNKKRIEYILR